MSTIAEGDITNYYYCLIYPSNKFMGAAWLGASNELVAN